jgi:E3 ubiquitin-protein ligase RGLG
LNNAASTHDQDVFAFYPDERPCNGFQEALARYREIVPHLRLSGMFLVNLEICSDQLNHGYNLNLGTVVCSPIGSSPPLFIVTNTDSPTCNFWHFQGPTSFAPIIEMATTIVEQSGGQYHVLVIIADGQVCPGTFLLFY